MKKVLLATTSLFGVAVAAGPAFAADGIKLGVGGFFKEAYMVNLDDNGHHDFGNNRNTDGFFNDAEVHFTGSTVLDNGLEVGARVELEGENDSDQIDEAWVYFSGGFGEVRVGSDDDALANACIVPPGGTGNFSAFSPNQWGANAGGLFAQFGGLSSNSVCSGVDDKSDAQKLIYITPNFGGFQLTASYTPNGGAEDHVDGAGPHIGMTHDNVGESRHNLSAYGTYQYEGSGWGLTAGLGGAWQGEIEDGNTDEHFDNKNDYQAAINLTLGNFAIGIVGEYYNNLDNVENSVSGVDDDAWVAGIGGSYTMDAWTFGLQYSHRKDDLTLSGDSAIDGNHADLSQDRVVATTNYALGPGILVDGEIGYSWVNTDPNLRDISDTDTNTDGYDALEIGLGTNITF
jgi:outer membrane protein OmpU